MSLASGCSGTELVVHAVNKMLAFWQKLFGISIECRHSYARENVGFKQEWIGARFSPDRTYVDLLELAASSAKDTSGNKATIKQVTVWFCGIERDSISGLNKGRAENYDSAGANGAATSIGATAQACMAYIARHTPPLDVLENARSLAVICLS